MIFQELFPHWIGSMTAMEVLYLGNNKFSGSLPPQMAQMSSLAVLGTFQE